MLQKYDKALKLDGVGPWHMTPDPWHLTPDSWPVNPDTWNVTHDMWHMVGVEHSLKISASHLLRFGIDSVLKILN